jgi:hypothetical protein
MLAVLSGLTLGDLERIRDYWRRSHEAAEAQIARLRGKAIG